ncbi:MAG TPA: FmdB family zinc ribbon protein [Spirochaetia bacterium]|nr:FmdB family zinc ribbon protein [Spirochaetia bacterium]
MPTYEYRCTNGHTFEAFQSIKDEPLTRCIKCKAAAKRVINGGMGVIFKGSGFYTTDYKKSSALTGGNGGSKEKKSESAPKESAKETAKPSASEGSKEKTKAS